ncbi:PadR family transcriptional regulator [Microbacterium kribbense]|uniref:PadR family transcriptional regulator n=1 Tax=Microbacterium kribbense TaxID=433645 RepID=A0ABP7G2A6_9MICO
MNDSFTSGRQDDHASHRGSGPDRFGFGLWDAVGNLREAFEQRVGPRMGRGDVRAAILALLREKPMHGYQLIHEIEERSSGAWKPSPGSVYPTLQLLADEDLVSVTEADGKKTYALTDAGREQAESAGDTAPWESPTARTAQRATALPKAGAKLAQVAMAVTRDGSAAQIDQAVAVIDDARRKLYSILAQD